MRPNLNSRQILLLAVFWAGIYGSMLGAGAYPRQDSDISGIPLDRFITKVERSYHDTRALEADFTQTYTAEGQVETQSGRMILARGGLMRWDYQEPERKLFISNGKTVELYLPSEQQLEKSSVKASEDYRVPFRLLLTRLDLRKYFSKIESPSSMSNQLAGDRTIIGIPKGGKDRPYEKVLIEFDPALNIRRLVITYRDRSVMTFVFTHIRRNPPMDSGLFRFTPPQGTAIINPADEGQN